MLDVEYFLMMKKKNLGKKAKKILSELTESSIDNSTSVSVFQQKNKIKRSGKK
jgi:hypothetical protein